MKKKLTVSALFVLSLLPMLLPQYGGCRGVQELPGIINLRNPIGIVSILLFVCGVWLPLCSKATGKLLGFLGCIGIVISEGCTFFTWHIPTITGALSLKTSLRLAFPEFYIGLAVSAAMVIAYGILENLPERH